jgi:hypothetical protein
MKYGLRVCSNLDVPYIGTLWDRPLASDEWPPLLALSRAVHLRVARAVLNVSNDEQVLRWLKQTAQGVELGVIEPRSLPWAQRVVASDWRFLSTTRAWVWFSLTLLLLWIFLRLTLWLIS